MTPKAASAAPIWKPENPERTALLCIHDCGCKCEVGKLRSGAL